MRILIDHGAFHNLGDISMLEAVALRLARTAPDVELCVRDRPGLKTELWQEPNVSRTTIHVAHPTDHAPSLSRLPYLWRYEDVCRTLWRNGCYALLGWGISPSRIPIDAGASCVPLGEFCRRYDALHIVGGGYLAESFADELWQKCCLLHAFASQGKPVILTGQQLGPFQTRWARRLLRGALRQVDFVGLREPTDSWAFCTDARLAPDHYALMGDDSFGLEPAEATEVEEVLARSGLSAGRFLAVNVRLGDYAPSHRQYVQHLAQLLTGLTRYYGLPLVVVPISRNDDDSDIRSGYQLQEALPEEVLHVLDDPDLGPRVIKGILGKAFAAVGVSYHFCTFALSQGVPAVCTFDGDYYAQKARGLARFWRDDRLLLPLRHCDSEAALQRATSLIDDTRFRETLQTQGPQAVHQWEAIFDRVVQHAYFSGHAHGAVCGPNAPGPVCRS